MRRSSALSVLIFVAACGDSPTNPGLDAVPQFGVDALVSQSAEIIDLGVTGPYSIARSVNESGVIVGWSREGSHYQGFVWEDGALGDLGFTVDSYFEDINEAGDVVGAFYPNPRYHQAFLWTKEDGVTPLDVGGVYSVASAINESRQVVGYTRGFGLQAFLWEDGVVRFLGAFGGMHSLAHDINDAGQIVGDAQLSDGRSHAFLWEDGVMQDLGTLGGLNSGAYAINEAGQVVGYADGPDGRRAFLWEDGVMQDLGTLGGQTSYGFGLNGSGQAVGYAYAGTSGVYRAFLSSNGSMKDLGGLGADHSSAEDINDGGWVVGHSMMANHEWHATLWIMRDPATKADCFGGAWEHFGFENQGQCVRFVAAGKDSR